MDYEEIARRSRLTTSWMPVIMDVPITAGAVSTPIVASFFANLVWDSPTDTLILPTSPNSGVATATYIHPSMVELVETCNMVQAGQPTLFGNSSTGACPSGLIACRARVTTKSASGFNDFDLLVMDSTFTDTYLDTGDITVTAGVLEFTFNKPAGITSIGVNISCQAGQAIGPNVASLDVVVELGI